MAFASRGIGYSGAAPTEKLRYIRPLAWHPDGTKRGVIFCRHAGGNADSLFTATVYLSIAQALAEAGYVTLAVDLGGDLWGNDTSTAAAGRMADGFTYLTSTLGCKSDKCGLLAVSEGASDALNWALANGAGKVAAVAGLIPAVDVQSVYDVNPGLKTSIDTAYGGAAAWTAAQPTHNPAARASSYTGLPIKLWYSTDDPTVLPATVTTFAAASGAATQSIGAQTHAATGTDPLEVLTFLRTYLA